jgi:cell division protease FtsH
VLVDRPDKKGRAEVLAVHVRKVKLAASVDMDQVAALTPGFTGADLANLVNEAALLATRRNGESVTLDDFTQAIERIVAGLEKRSRILNAKEREIIAAHEVGHALVAMALTGSDPVQKISIIPRGIGALGYTMQRPIEDRFVMSQAELENRLAVLLGGRAAEMLRFASVSTGAADDLRKATDIARSMAARFGMVPELGAVSYDSESSTFLTPVPGMIAAPPWYSDATAAKIDSAILRIVDAASKRAREILELNRSLLESTALKLLERETLGPEELEPLVPRRPSRCTAGNSGGPTATARCWPTAAVSRSIFPTINPEAIHFGGAASERVRWKVAPSPFVLSTIRIHRSASGSRPSGAIPPVYCGAGITPKNRRPLRSASSFRISARWSRTMMV